jgi:hypothetical protein
MCEVQFCKIRGRGMVKVYMRGSGAIPVIEGFSKELAGIW